MGDIDFIRSQKVLIDDGCRRFSFCIWFGHLAKNIAPTEHNGGYSHIGLQYNELRRVRGKGGIER